MIKTHFDLDRLSNVITISPPDSHKTIVDAYLHSSAYLFKPTFIIQITPRYRACRIYVNCPLFDRWTQHHIVCRVTL